MDHLANHSCNFSDVTWAPCPIGFINMVFNVFWYKQVQAARVMTQTYLWFFSLHSAWIMTHIKARLCLKLWERWIHQPKGQWWAPHLGLFLEVAVQSFCARVLLSMWSVKGAKKWKRIPVEDKRQTTTKAFAKNLSRCYINNYTCPH